MTCAPTEPTANCDDLHARLLSGEPTAPADLFACYGTSLTRQLAARFPTTDPDLIHDAIVTALLDVAEHPERFDPERRSFGGYLHMVASGDLLNLIAKQQRRRKHEMADDPVELESAGRNIRSGQADAVGEEVADRESAATLAQLAMAVAQTEEERVVMRLMLDGERATEVFARALGIAALSPAAQRAHVYGIKDRLTKRLRRRWSSNV